MDLIVEHVDVWAASIKDAPGGLADKLSVIAEAGADLDFIVARRSPEQPGTGVVFVAPLQGDAEIAAATQAGFNVTNSLHSLRVEGDNRPGAAAEITTKLGQAGLNIRGLSAAVIGTRYILYMAFDSPEDAATAEKTLTARGKSHSGCE